MKSLVKSKGIWRCIFVWLRIEWNSSEKKNEDDGCVIRKGQYGDRNARAIQKLGQEVILY